MYSKHIKAYHTSDGVRYRLADSQLGFFGHMDRQVKIRGHRPELGKVEHARLLNNTVTNAATLTREPDGEKQELVSFITVNRDKFPSRP